MTQESKPIDVEDLASKVPPGSFGDWSKIDPKLVAEIGEALKAIPSRDVARIRDDVLNAAASTADANKAVAKIVAVLQGAGEIAGLVARFLV